jgi:hypothetical protein
MKASKMITLKQRKQLYGEYILLKNSKAINKSISFEFFLTHTIKLK